ncbi:hypothetical protein V1478_018837 [Vespula squamosa]|uniref:Uncharacterized protein n=1 Tax=Vespula squamosa TaxID=30214 RepID=A0ABD1ZUA8_VESSQ
MMSAALDEDFIPRMCVTKNPREFDGRSASSSCSLHKLCAVRCRLEGTTPVRDLVSRSSCSSGIREEKPPVRRCTDDVPALTAPYPATVV